MVENAARDELKGMVSSWSSRSTAAFARWPRPNTPARSGLDLIISDHHEPSARAALLRWLWINPKQPGDAYPEKNLAGVGLAFKIVGGA